MHLSWVLGFPCSFTSWNGLGLLLGTKWHLVTPAHHRRAGTLCWPKDPSESGLCPCLQPHLWCCPSSCLQLCLFVLLLFFFNWDIVALQYCVSSCCAMKWISSVYMYDGPPTPSPHPSRSPQAMQRSPPGCFTHGRAHDVNPNLAIQKQFPKHACSDAHGFSSFVSSFLVHYAPSSIFLFEMFLRTIFTQSIFRNLDLVP